MAAYTEQETDRILSEYQADPTPETVFRLAEELARSTRSIIAKLSNAGIYKPPAKVTKAGEPIIRKETMAKDIGDWLGIEVPSLAKTSKIELRMLHVALSDPLVLRAHLVDLEEDNEVHT